MDLCLGKKPWLYQGLNECRVSYIKCLAISSCTILMIPCFTDFLSSDRLPMGSGWISRTKGGEGLRPSLLHVCMWPASSAHAWTHKAHALYSHAHTPEHTQAHTPVLTHVYAPVHTHAHHLTPTPYLSKAAPGSRSSCSEVSSPMRAAAGGGAARMSYLDTGVT